MEEPEGSGGRGSIGKEGEERKEKGKGEESRGEKATVSQSGRSEKKGRKRSGGDSGGKRFGSRSPQKKALLEEGKEIDEASQAEEEVQQQFQFEFREREQQKLKQFFKHGGGLRGVRPDPHGKAVGREVSGSADSVLLGLHTGTAVDHSRSIV